MPAHAAFQLPGGRNVQCDATATATVGDVRAYALLDGIGDNEDVRDWTRRTARRLARAAAGRGDAEAGLRAVHQRIAAEPERAGWRYGYQPGAVAVVAVAAPGKPVSIAWCGDARAYGFTHPEGLRKLTEDHNMRQALINMGQTPGPNARHQVLSHLGSNTAKPMIGSTTWAAKGWLLLVSDGVYEPMEESCRSLGSYLGGYEPKHAVRHLVTDAVELSTSRRADNATALAVRLDR